MLSPIGNSYGYYTSSPYATGHTAAAAHTAMISDNHDAGLEVQAVTDVPEVFSNEDTERVQRTPSELAQDRLMAYEQMTSLTIRSGEQLNPSLEFMTKKPFEPDIAHLKKEKASDTESAPASVEVAALLHRPADISTKDSVLQSSAQIRSLYQAQLDAYSAFTQNNNGFYARA